MTLFSYEIFDAVARQGSFNKAAQQLHLTPSAISHAIAVMEEELGFALFNRGKNGVSMTSYGAVQLGDIRLNLFDTAGLRETEDAIEAEGIRRSWKKLEEAGLILAVFDGSEPPSREDLALAQRCAGRPAIALVNKEDKPTRFDAELIAPYFAMVLPVCCREEGSRKVIAAAVARLLGTGSIDPHAASLSGQRQLSAALRARDAVAGALDAAAGGFGLDAVSVCVDDALDALCDLTGENASEAVIEQVFERFCVGK